MDTVESLNGSGPVRYDRVQSQVAILFDAENVSPRYVDEVIEKAGCYKKKPIIRAYADFSRPNTKGWERPAIRHGIRTIHQFSQVSGNSSSDFLMMYDAFKLLHTGKTAKFVVVTNDHDFITPIQLLRQSGGVVHGFAEQGKARDVLVRSCDKFSYLSNCLSLADGGVVEVESDRVPLHIMKSLVKAFVSIAPSNEWVSLSRLGQVANVPLKGTGYRFRSLSRMLRASALFETDSDRGHQYVRAMNHVTNSAV